MLEAYAGIPFQRMIHSKTDDLIAFHHGEKIFDAAPEPKRFLEIHGEHNIGFEKSDAIYRPALRQLFADYIGKLIFAYAGLNRQFHVVHTAQKVKAGLSQFVSYKYFQHRLVSFCLNHAIRRNSIATSQLSCEPRIMTT